jgi:hypothetical protein
MPPDMTPLPLILLALASCQEPATPAASRGPADDVRVRARVKDEQLAVGAEHEIVLEIAWAGASAGKSGVPAPILQIDLPPSVELVGEALTTFDQLKRNEFLMEPWERLVDELPATIGFRLVAEPGADETIGLVVLAYVSTEPGVDDAFLRRRLELPVKGGAVARPGNDADSSWGPDDTLYVIGDRVEPFDLPRADGSRLDLSQRLGAGNVIVTTYRAHW